MSCGSVTYAGIPFVLDRVVPTLGKRLDRDELIEGKRNGSSSLLRPDGEINLIDYLNQILPSRYLNDYVPASQFPGRNIGAIATPAVTDTPFRQIGIGEWYYPTGASRWSVFRGLATSTQVKAMVKAALHDGARACPLVMINSPVSPDNPNNNVGAYTVTSDMWLLPPRPLAEHGGSCDGLFLVTLVDERYYWQFKTVSLAPTKDTTWADLLSSIGSALGASVTQPDIPAAYTQPEADSPLWCNFENAAFLMDAASANIGCSFVRRLDGACVIEPTPQSLAIVDFNRGLPSKVVRTAGGDMFYSGTKLPSGPLWESKNAVCPGTVKVTFPKYIYGDDPVPHFQNSRYTNQRPTSWYEDSYGDVHEISIPIGSGDITSGNQVFQLSGFNLTPPAGFLNGVIGNGTTWTMHSTAKALLATEGATPGNDSDLTALATLLASNYWAQQAGSALDEVYPGTYAWVPEGINDLVWTYSATLKQASTRVMRSEWNVQVREFSHATPPIAGQTNHPKGAGGTSVAQASRDSYTLSGSTFATSLQGGLGAGGTQAFLSTVDYLPTCNRWRGQIGQEAILFEGTSGGQPTSGNPSNLSGIQVGIVARGIDGTQATSHSGGAPLTWIQPDAAYGNNSLRGGEGFFWFQDTFQDKGLHGSVLECPLRTIFVFSDTTTTINGTRYHSGRLENYDPTVRNSGPYVDRGLIWARDRNGVPLNSGRYYGGQLVGFSASGVVAPIYLTNEGTATSGGQWPSVADQYTLQGGSYTLGSPLPSFGAATAELVPIDYLPTQNRWYGVIDSELFLFDGTSGLPGTVGIAARGLNGTASVAHNSGSPGGWILPDDVNQVARTTFAKGFFVNPGEFSGNVNEALVLCPTRTVFCEQTADTPIINSIYYYYGRANVFDTASSGGLESGTFPVEENILLIERNNRPLVSGKRYDGQLVGYSKVGESASGTDVTRPIYAVNDEQPRVVIRDTYSHGSPAADVSALTSGSSTAGFSNINFFPFDNRWVGLIDSEKILFEGSSGSTTLTIVQRGFAGTDISQHSSGAGVSWIAPDLNSGVDVVRFGRGTFAFPGLQPFESGYTEAVVNSLERTVRVLDGTGAVFNTIRNYSGQVVDYDPEQSSGQQWINRGPAWIQERNGIVPVSGKYYDGQFMNYGWSGAGPVYVINEYPSSGSVFSGVLTSGSVTSGYLGDGSVVSGSLRSGLFPIGTWTGYDELSSQVFANSLFSGTTFLASGSVTPYLGWWDAGGFGNYNVTLPPIAYSPGSFIGFRGLNSGNLLSGSYSLLATSGQLIYGPRGPTSGRTFNQSEVVVLWNTTSAAGQRGHWVKHETMLEQGFYATRSTNQTITGSATLVQFNTETWDIGDCYDNSTYQFLPHVQGIYNIGAIVSIENVAVAANLKLEIYKNGSPYKTLSQVTVAAGVGDDYTINGSTEISLNGRTDYVEMYFTVADGFGGSYSTPASDTGMGFWASRIRRDEQ